MTTDELDDKKRPGVQSVTNETNEAANTEIPVAQHEDAHKKEQQKSQNFSKATAQPTITKPTAATYGYNDIISRLEEEQARLAAPSAEQLKKEQRRRKTQGIISAIADGASAISNLITTTQYAPNMYTPDSSLTGKWRERWEKLKAERDANADKHLNVSLLLGKYKNERDQMEYQRDRDALADQYRAMQDKRAEAQELRQQAEADRQAALHELNLMLQMHKVSGAEAEAERKRIDAKYEDAVKQSVIAKNRAAASASYARGEHYKNGGNGKEPIILELEDETKSYSNPNNYKKDVLFYAKQYGVPTTTTRSKGLLDEPEEVPRSIEAIAADVKAEAAKRKADKETSSMRKGAGYGGKPSTASTKGKGAGYGGK